MQIQNNKFRYCTICKTTQKKGEMISVCPICHNHCSNLYDLKIHNLSTVNSTSACKDCTTSLYKIARQGKEDPWISEMMELTDEF